MSKRTKETIEDIDEERSYELSAGSVGEAALEAAEETEDDDRVPISEIVFEWANTLFAALVVVLLIMTFFFRQVTVNGRSMNDTLQNDDRLIVASFMYTPACGDIVIITHGEKYNEPIVKRIIATEGQKLSIDYETNEVTVDGTVLDEPYIKGKTIQRPNPTEIPDVIPEGYVFVMGDNREDSLDSRSVKIGLIPVENIIGKAFFRIAPFDKFGFVS